MKVEDLEKFSDKVRSDIVKIDLLEAENRRLKKKFEETTCRLRRYNGELRHALIKEQAQDPGIQIPDGGGDGQLFSDEFVKEVNQTRICEAVVFNSVAMDLIFKKLDVKTIKKCRLMCRNWNETACRILARQNGGYGLAVLLEERKVLENIQDLNTIVASAPENWFSKALLSKNCTEMTEIQSVLKNFGYRLRSIEITGCEFLFRDTHKILVNWCPNLEQLALPISLSVEWGESEVKDGYEKLVFPLPLKLTGLFMQEQFCISIVKASPNLKTLSCVADMDGLDFFQELETCPEVTRNLENMTLYCLAAMQEFNKVRFSSNLKKLEINVLGQFQAEELYEAFKNLGGTLEKLVLIVSHVRASGYNHHLEFPKMNNLIELRCLSDTSTIQINSIEFLTAMPNLKSLYLGHHSRQTFQALPARDNFIDNWFCNCPQLRRRPHKMLEELYLFGIIDSPSRTFEMMCQVFPNLTKLTVEMPVLYKCTNDRQELRKYYEDVFNGGLSEMANLKELYLDFRIRGSTAEEETKFNLYNSFDYMSVIFSQLNKLSNLTTLNHLTIRTNSKSSKSTTELVGDKLLEIPNLQRVTLIGLKVELRAAKELTMLLHKHEIQLEIKDTDVREDFRIHFEEIRTFRNRKFSV